jgi:hypothetical protein
LLKSLHCFHKQLAVTEHSGGLAMVGVIKQFTGQPNGHRFRFQRKKVPDDVKKVSEYIEWYKENYGVEPDERPIQKFCALNNGIIDDRVKQQEPCLICGEVHDGNCI